MTDAEGLTPDATAEAWAALEQALAGGDPDAATAAFKRFAELAPESPELPALRRRLDEQGARAVREAVAKAERLIGQGQPRRALDALARIRAVVPDHPELARLEAQAQRAVEAVDQRARVRPLVDKARKLSVRGELEAALAAAEEAVSAAPDDARALRLRDELQERVEEARRAAQETGTTAGSPAPVAPRERIRALLVSASAQLARDELEAAERDVQAALEMSPAEPDAQALVKRIRARRGERERAARIETLVADAGRLLESGRFQACLALVAQLAKLEPAHPAADELQARADEGRRQSEARRAAIRAAFQDGQAALVAGDWGRAIERFSAVLADDAAHAEARRGLAEARARAARRERIVAMLASARVRLACNEIEAAEREVQEALRLDPQDPEALALSEEVWLRGRELRRIQGAAPPRPAAETPRVESRSGVESVRIEGPPSAEAAHPAVEAAEARARVAVHEARAAVERSLGGSDPDAVALALRRFAALAPASPDLAGLLRRVEEHRERAAREPLAEAEHWIRAGRPERALDALGRVRALAPEHPALAKLEAQAQRAAQERDVRGRVQALVDRALALSSQGDLAGALAAAEEAVGTAPDDARALRLRDELQDRVRQTEREQKGP